MISEELISYERCHEYARSLCGQHGIPQCDVADIGSDAYLLAIRRSWRAADTDDPETVAQQLMYAAVIDVIRRRNNKGSRRVLGDAASSPRREKRVIEVKVNGRAALCRGRGRDGARPSRGFATTSTHHSFMTRRGRRVPIVCTPLVGTPPFWLKLFRNERRKLKGNEKKTVKYLYKDSRLPIAREKLGVSRPTFLTIVKNLRVHFDQCFRALCEWRDQN